MRPGSDRCIPASTSPTHLSRSTPFVIMLLIGLALAGSAQASQGWLAFSTEGRWLAARSATAPSAGQDRRFELADLNHDGKLDFVTNVAGGVKSALGNGDGTFQALRYFGDGTSPERSFALGDLNRDGNPDAVVSDDATGAATVSVFLGDGTGGFGARTAFSLTGEGVRTLSLGDVNRDGALDLAYTSWVSGGPYVVGIALGNGTGGFGVPTMYAESSPPTFMSLADLNRDGKLDMLVAESGPNQVCYRLGNGNGTFGAATRIAASGKITDLQAYDLNRDGRVDLIWTCAGTTNDSTSIALAQSGGGFAAASTLPLLGHSDVLAIGDFNEDGLPDLIALLPDSRTLYPGIGDGTFGAPITVAGLPINFSMVNVEVADLNQDGHLDIVYGLPAVDFGN